MPCYTVKNNQAVQHTLDSLSRSIFLQLAVILLITSIISGTAIGSISALVSISGAGLTVPYLMHQNFKVKRAIGTSAAIGFPVALSGTLGYLINGQVNTDWNNLIIGYVYLPAVALFAISSYFATSFGVQYATILPADKLKKIIGILSIALSIKMFLSVI